MTPLTPPPERPSHELWADTALAAAVLLPGGGMIVRPLRAHEAARPRPRPLFTPDTLPRPGTRAVVAAAAAAAAEARRDTVTPSPADSGLAATAASGAVLPPGPSVSNEARNE